MPKEDQITASARAAVAAAEEGYDWLYLTYIPPGHLFY